MIFAWFKYKKNIENVTERIGYKKGNGVAIGGMFCSQSLIYVRCGKVESLYKNIILRNAREKKPAAEEEANHMHDCRHSSNHGVFKKLYQRGGVMA